METNIEKAESLNRKYVKYLPYYDVYEYGLKLLRKFYDPSKNDISKEDLGLSIMLYDIINYGASVEQISHNFNRVVASVVFKIYDDKDDHKLKGYEKLFDKEYDFIFTKLLVRISKIFAAIRNLQDEEFRGYIDEYNELRRKLLKNADPDLMKLMDYESDLIKYGRNIFAGKPATSYKYQNLIVDA